MTGFEHLLIGRKLAGRYLVESLVGSGGMGAVFRATDESLGRSVAVKVVAYARVDEDTARLRTRFRREARAAAGIAHPNVVTVFDFGTDPGLDLDFLVMEMLEGQDLSAALRSRGPFSAGEVLSILRQAAGGLGAGHLRGIVHRDVKPGNLYLVGEGVGSLVKVLDFGIADAGAVADAETLTRLTVLGTVPHTKGYASPEQERGETLTPASDVYSLGVTGLVLLTGWAPGAPEWAAGPAALLERLTDTGELRPVLRRALAPSPAGRFPDGTVFEEALGRVSNAGASGGSQPADPIPLTSTVAAPPVRAMRRTRSLKGVGLYGLGGLAVAAMLVLVGSITGLRGTSLRTDDPTATWAVPVNPEDVDRVIRQIRAEYTAINGAERRMSWRTVALRGDAAPGYAKVFRDTGEVRKVTVTFAGSWRQRRMEAYFAKDSVVFIYLTGGHTASGEPYRAEERYYFDDTHPVRVRVGTRVASGAEIDAADARFAEMYRSYAMSIADAASRGVEEISLPAVSLE